MDLVKHVYSNGDLFATDFSYIKVCFNLCVRLLAIFFSWPQFSDGNATETLLKGNSNKMHFYLEAISSTHIQCFYIESLLVLLDESKRKSFHKKPAADVAAAVFDIMLAFESSIVDLKTAVYLHDLLKVLKRFSSITSTNKSNELEQRKTLSENHEKEIR